MSEQKKTVYVVVAGSGKKFEVQILPGVTTRDLLEKLGLHGHLSKYGEPTPFAENEELYPRVEEGDKLLVGPTTPVGR